uniref:Uncharacterized protein n=2 Tax=Bradyrhizobium barranii subsp. barranii TaxID=2823807 RepID=A0A7Z0Q6D7_9BRAD
MRASGQPGGCASIEIVKQHLAIYYCSGPEWPARMTRIASRAPDLDIFGDRLIDREVGYWTITAKGLEVLDALEQLDRRAAQDQSRPQAEQPAADERPLPATPPQPIARLNRPRRKRLHTRKGRSA